MHELMVNLIGIFNKFQCKYYMQNISEIVWVWNKNLGPQKSQNSTLVGNFYVYKMGDFKNMIYDQKLNFNQFCQFVPFSLRLCDFCYIFPDFDGLILLVIID